MPRIVVTNTKGAVGKTTGTSTVTAANASMAHDSADRATKGPATAGLTLIGARVYNQQRGLFTSTDPVFGGNETSYGYPDDPVNSSDLTGLSHYKYNWRLMLA